MGPAGWYVWFYMPYSMRYFHQFWFYPYYTSPWFFTKEEDKAHLEGQANTLEEQLAQIRKRLEKLKKEGKESK